MEDQSKEIERLRLQVKNLEKLLIASVFCKNSFLSAFFPLPVKRYCFE